MNPILYGVYKETPKQAGIIRKNIPGTYVEGAGAIQTRERSGLNRLFQGSVYDDPNIQMIFALNRLAYGNPNAQRELALMAGQPDTPIENEDDTAIATGLALQSAKPKYFSALDGGVTRVDVDPKMLDAVKLILQYAKPKQRLLIGDGTPNKYEMDESYPPVAKAAKGPMDALNSLVPKEPGAGSNAAVSLLNMLRAIKHNLPVKLYGTPSAAGHRLKDTLTAAGIGGGLGYLIADNDSEGKPQRLSGAINGALLGGAAGNIFNRGYVGTPLPMGLDVIRPN